MEYEGLRVGETIRYFREQKGLTREELSYRLNKSVSHMYQVEAGRHKISIDTLYRLVEVLGVDANTILLSTEPKKEFEVSIDIELKRLPEADNHYLSSVFRYMIDQIRVGERGEETA